MVDEERTLKLDLLNLDPLEKLALLESHAIDWRHIPSGWQHLTASDIAGTLAKVPRGASLLVRVKYANQERFKPDLIYWLKVEVFDEIIKSPVQPIHDKLINLAINEVLDPRICKTCKGVGNLPVEAKLLACEDCNGGKYAWTEHSRATYCGIHHEVWKRRWSRMYTEILTIPWTWEGQAREVCS